MDWIIRSVCYLLAESINRWQISKPQLTTSWKSYCWMYGPLPKQSTLSVILATMSCVFLKLTVPWKKLPDGLSDVTNKSFHEPLLKSHYRGVASFFCGGSRSASRLRRTTTPNTFLKNSLQAKFTQFLLFLGLFCTAKWVWTAKLSENSAACENFLEYGPNYQLRGSSNILMRKSCKGWGLLIYVNKRFGRLQPTFRVLDREIVEFEFLIFKIHKCKGFPQTQILCNVAYVFTDQLVKRLSHKLIGTIRKAFTLAGILRLTW